MSITDDSPVRELSRSLSRISQFRNLSSNASYERSLYKFSWLSSGNRDEEVDPSTLVPRVDSMSPVSRLKNVNTTAEYERSLHKYPWLSPREEVEPSEEDFTSSLVRPVLPRSFLPDTEYRPWMADPQKQKYHGLSTADCERDSLQEESEGSVNSTYDPSIYRDAANEALTEDPNLVSVHPP